MPTTHILPPSEQTYAVSRFEQIKFYLKAGAVILATTAVYAASRAGNLLPNWRGSTVPSNNPFSDPTAITTQTNTMVDPNEMKLVWLIDNKAISNPSIEEKILAASVVQSIPVSRLTDFQEIPLVLSEIVAMDEKNGEDNDIKAPSPAKHKLLQIPNTPVVVANPVPDQIIQIGDPYSYSLDQVFSGDYIAIGALQENSNAMVLPSWLQLQCKKLSSFSLIGFSRGIAVDGNTLFVGHDIYGLAILDVSNPVNPILLSNYPAAMQGYSDYVAVANNIVYVGNGMGGLQIIDVKNLTNPQLLSDYTQITSWAFYVVVSGNTVFLTDGTGLRIIDVSNLVLPNLVGTYSYPQGVGISYGIAVSGNTVFMADYGIGLEIIDVTDLTHPEFLSRYYTPTRNAQSVAISENIVFVVDCSAGLQIFDVSDLSNPKFLSSYPANGGTGEDIKIWKNLVILANGASGLQIIDVSNLSDPILLSSYPAGGDLAYGVATSDSTVFISNGLVGVQIVDISHVILVGIPPDSSIGQKFSIKLLAIDNSTNSTLGFAGDAFDVFEITLDNLPRLGSTILIDQSLLPNQFLALPIETKNIFIYPDLPSLKLSLTLKNDEPIPSWMSFVLAPTLLSTYYPVSVFESATNNIIVLGNTMFLADSKGGFQIVNVNDLANPYLLGSYPAGNGGNSYNLAISGNIAFIANGVAGLQIINITDFMNPILLYTYLTSDNGTAYGVEIYQDTAFLANGNQGLQLINVTNPISPQFISSIYLDGGSAYNVALSENVAFVANGNSGLYAIDISDFSNPRLLMEIVVYML